MGPQGPQGETGPTGSTGADGPTGPQGPPGEVTSAQLESSISNALQQTSANSNGVPQLTLSISDPPTQAEVQALVDAYNTLLLALRR